MSLKPLYLAHGRNASVRHQKDILLVRRIGKAASIYPFRRLSRVVSAHDVQWQDGALVACLQAGVPVSFIDGNGNPLGYCSGIRRRETTLEGLLRQAIETSDWDNYPTWLKGMEQQAMRKAASDARLRCPTMNPDTLRSGFCNAYNSLTGTAGSALFKHIDGALSTYIHQTLSTVFVSPELLDFPLPGLSFISDIHKILRWPTYALYIAHVHHMEHHAPAARNAATLLQRFEPSIFNRQTEILRRMELWLRSLVL